MEDVWNVYATCLSCALLYLSRANTDANGVSFVCRFSTKGAWSPFGASRWQGMCMEYAWICVECVWHMNAMSMEDVWNMHGIYIYICMEHVRNMHGTCMEYAWNIYGLPMEYVGICME